MKIVNLYNTPISNPYMAAEFDNGEFYGVRFDSANERFVVGQPIDKCGVTREMLSPVSRGEMAVLYNAHLDKFAFPIRFLRIAAGMSQVQFAEYIGVPRRTVENWEYRGGCPDYVASLIEYKLKNENKI